METLLLWTEFVAGLLIFPILLYIPAPYGRFSRSGWGTLVSGKLGWMLFESVPLVALPLSFFYKSVYFATITSYQKLLLGLWIVHYIHRSLIYSFNAPSMKPTALITVLSAILFNSINGYLNGKGLQRVQSFEFPIQMSLGLGLFLVGMMINISSDYALFALRDSKSKKSNSSKSKYSIPKGGLFEYISCPNYFGELLEWIGWALASNQPAGWAFALFTFANLAPRALQTHAWYKKTFSRYPKHRKALIPWIL